MVVLGERSQIPMYGSGLSTPLAWYRPRPYTAELQTCLETAAEAAPSILLRVLVALSVSFHLRPPDLLSPFPSRQSPQRCLAPYSCCRGVSSLLWALCCNLEGSNCTPGFGVPAVLPSPCPVPSPGHEFCVAPVLSCHPLLLMLLARKITLHTGQLGSPGP